MLPHSTHPYTHIASTVIHRILPAYLIYRILTVSIIAVLTVSLTESVHAQATSSVIQYDIPAGPLAEALNRFALQAGVTIVIDTNMTNGLNTPGLKGTYNIEEGFSTLLRGSGYTIEETSAGYVLAPIPGITGAATTLPVVTVTDTRGSSNELPEPYAGGLVARGARIGVLGNSDFMEVPMSIVSFTSEFKEATQALSVSDMLKYSVSAQTPQAGSVPTTDVIYVRGFNIGSYESTFDGLPGGLLGRMPPVESIERVELLLGASAFANGTPYAVGGNINIVPKRAGDEPLLRVGANFRTRSIIGTTIDAGRRFGPNNAFGARANFAYSEGDTELKNGSRKALSRALALDYRGERTRLTLDYMGNNRNLPAEAWFTVGNGIQVPRARDASRNFRQPWTKYADDWDTIVARGEWDINKEWTISAAYGHMWTTVERFSQVYSIIDDSGSMESWGTSASKQRRQAHSGEIKINGNFSTGPIAHHFQAGYTRFGDKGKYVGRGTDSFFSHDSNIYNPVYYPKPQIDDFRLPPHITSRTRNHGLFFSDQLSLFDDRLRIMAGARRVTYGFSYYDSQTGNLEEEPYKESRWSPAFGVVVKAHSKLSLYANRLESLEPGYQVSPPAANAGQFLRPALAEQIEFGAKADFGALAATLALFEIEKQNIYLDPATNLTGPNGRQVNRGVELSVFGEPLSGLRLYSSMTWLDAKLKRTQSGQFDGNRAHSTPTFMANLFADWDIPGVTGLSLLGGMSYSNRTYANNANTLSLPDWIRFDTGIRYRTAIFKRATTLQFNVDNVFNKKYWIPERGTIYMAPERTMIASIIVGF